MWLIVQFIYFQLSLSFDFLIILLICDIDKLYFSDKSTIVMVDLSFI